MIRPHEIYYSCAIEENHSCIWSYMKLVEIIWLRIRFFFNVSRRAAKFIDKQEDGEETTLLGL
jgi:hypothetical protein